MELKYTIHRFLEPRERLFLGEQCLLNEPPFNWKQKMPLQKFQPTLAQHACSGAAGMSAACSLWSCTCLLPPLPWAGAITSSLKMSSHECGGHNNSFFVFRLTGLAKAVRPKAVVVYLTCKHGCFHLNENLHVLHRKSFRVW